MAATNEIPGVAKAPETQGKQYSGFLKNNIREYGMLLSLVAIMVFFQFMTDGTLMEPLNLTNLVLQNSYIVIMALGMLLVIVAGHIDLSVGSVAAFVGVVVAQSMAVWHLPAGLAMLLGLVVGALVGAWQGFWVAYVRVPAFIVTLAGQLIFRGANQVVGNSTAVPTPASYNWIGNGFLPDFGPDFGYSNPTLILGLIVVVAGLLVSVPSALAVTAGRESFALSRSGAAAAPARPAEARPSGKFSPLARTTLLTLVGKAYCAA